jgi:hypothetical protein
LRTFRPAPGSLAALLTPAAAGPSSAMSPAMPTLTNESQFGTLGRPEAVPFRASPELMGTEDPEGKMWDERLGDCESLWNRERDRRERYVKLFRDGRFPMGEGSAADADGVSVNLCYSWASSVTAWLMGQAPTIAVDPRRAGQDEQAAEVLEKWLGYSFQEGNSIIPNEVVVFDAILRGMAWSKESFDSKRGIDVVDALTPLDVALDPLAKYSVAQGRWMVQRCVRPIDEARAFFNRKDLEPNYQLANEKGLSAERTRDRSACSDKDLLLYYEIWWKDGERRRLLYRLKDKQMWLGQSQWPYVLDDDEFPFSPLIFNTVYQGVDGFSEMQVVDGLRLEVEELAEFDRRHTRRAAAKKILFDESVFAPEDIQKFTSGRDMEAISAKLGGKALADVLRVVDFNSNTDEQKGKFERVRQLFNDILGFDELLRGGEQKKLTATQADIVAEFARLKLGRRLTSVDRFQSTQLRHRAQIARMWVTPELVAQAISPEAGMVWAQWASDPADVTREFSISIQAGSTGERAKALRAKQAEERIDRFIAINGALIAQGGAPAFDLVEAGMDLLRASGERNPEKYRLPPPPPMPAPMDPAAGGAPMEGEAMPAEMGAPSPNVIAMEGAA